MDFQLPDEAPAVTRSIPTHQLKGTHASLDKAARAAGYTTRAVRAIGSQTLALIGIRDGWAFSATHSEQNGWDVRIYRPGWPHALSNVTQLRHQLKAQQHA